MSDTCENTLTYVCRSSAGASLMMDVGPSEREPVVREHARGLLAEHLTSATVEVWRHDGLIEIVRRADRT